MHLNHTDLTENIENILLLSYRNQTYNSKSNKNYKLRQQLMTRDEFIKKLNKIGEENGEIINLFRKKKEKEINSDEDI